MASDQVTVDLMNKMVSLVLESNASQIEAQAALKAAAQIVSILVELPLVPDAIAMGHLTTRPIQRKPGAP